MSIRTILAVAILWVVSLFAVGTVVKAQAYLVNPLPEPRILSGPDFGIRIEGEHVVREFLAISEQLTHSILIYHEAD